MRIFNIRLGHACNSSSTHSIVPLAAVGGHASDSYDGDEFGWDHFTLATPEAKMKYLASTLGCLNAPADRIEGITGVKPDPTDEWYGGFGYVDHQSLLALPLEGPHADDFLADLAEYLKRDDVVVLGGNDNGGRTGGVHLPLDTEGAEPKLRPGTAPDGSRYWTVMRRWTGDRVRFSFTDQPLSGPGDDEYGIPPVEAEIDLPYADLPELVDMKVTAFCPFEKDCPWCYMASTRDGAHADWPTAMAWLDAFREAEVFEVALGGGEPTLWPHLGAFVKCAGEAGINVNLTTKNIAWIKPANLAGLGAIAVSLNNRRDLERFAAVDLSELGYPRPEVTVQCVPAFCDDDLLADIIALAKERALRVTFLGVKRTGRALAEERQDDLRWLELLKPYRGDWWLVRGVAVDTLMASAAREAFEALGVDPVWYETTEGKFSCYVDATAGTIGVSSYADEQIRCEPDGFADGFHGVQRIAGIRPVAA